MMAADPSYFCPRCGAMLDGDFLATAGEELDCPECDQPVRRDAVMRGTAGPSEPEPAASDLQPESDAEAPPGGRLDCRLIDRQLVIYIRPGTNRTVRAIGCFAVMWLGFMAVFTGIMVGAGAGLPDLPGSLFFLLFLGVFWAVGLGMFYFWIRGRFGKTYVLVEPGRLVMKTDLFGRESFKEYPLLVGSRAELAEAYSQNDRPVYKIVVPTARRSVGFGTFLSDEEKEWLVARINRHLGV